MEITDELAAVTRRIERIAAGPRFDGDARFENTVVQAIPAPRPGIERIIGAAAGQYGVDPALVEAVVANESGYDPNATSAAGARGLMQLMPGTAAALGLGDAYDASQNVRAGTRYLRGLLDRFGDVELAVAAYNAGPNAVARYGGVPPFSETRKYVANVMAEYRRRSQLGNGASTARSQRSVTIER